MQKKEEYLKKCTGCLSCKYFLGEDKYGWGHCKLKEGEIQVGEYVRTKEGLIRKILQSDYIEEYKAYRYKVDKDVSIKFNIIWQRDIRKHSFNLIDLIEVGDYVNGERVFATGNRINDNGEKVILVENYNEWTDDGVIANKDIKTIVTHEQFKAMEYKVGGEDDQC